MSDKTAVRGFDPDAGDAAAAVAAGIRSAEPSITTIDEALGLYVVPDGNGSTKVLSLEDKFKNPTRPKGSATVADIESFVAYVTRYLSPATVISLKDAEGLAVLNYHASKDGAEPTPGWDDWKVTLKLGHSPEWLQWVGADGRGMTQLQFAEWLELYAADVSEPDAAALLEICRSLEGTVTARFEHAVRLDNGDRQLVFKEDTSVSGSKGGDVEVPRSFKVKLRVYNGDIDTIELTALLRYKVASETIVFLYTFGNQPPKAIELARDAWHARIREAFPETLIVRAP